MTAFESAIGIREMSQRCGLSPDTLRWYEKESILPPVGRGSDGRRAYTERDQSLVILLCALREAGMSAEQMRAFVQLVAEGAASHGQRIALLEEVRAELSRRRAALDRAEQALETKVQHYRDLIDRGLDCDGAPVPDGVRAVQASPIPTPSKELP